MCLTSEQRDFEGLLASADLLLLVTDLELPAPLVNSRFPTCAVGLCLQSSLSPCRSIWSSWTQGRESITIPNNRTASETEADVCHLGCCKEGGHTLQLSNHNTQLH